MLLRRKSTQQTKVNKINVDIKNINTYVDIIKW